LAVEHPDVPGDLCGVFLGDVPRVGGRFASYHDRARALGWSPCLQPILSQWHQLRQRTRATLLSPVDANFVGRQNRSVGAEIHTDVVSEIARLRLSIDRVAAAIEITLAGHPPTSRDEGPRLLVADQKELRRQLAALRERVDLAEQAHEGPRALRAELATLLFFAKTLQADAVDWRSALEERIKELERQRAAARREQERLAAERQKLVPRRDAIRSRVVQTAAQMADQCGGECRSTLPVVAIGAGLAVCSVSVSCPRRGLRFAKRWLVTLDDSRDDVTVIRDY
jgi:hypothetical protein